MYGSSVRIAPGVLNIKIEVGIECQKKMINLFSMFRNWQNVKVGQIVTAKKHVPALMEAAIQFSKGEKAKIADVTDKSIGIHDKYGDITYFNKQKDKIDFVGDWFK